MPIQIAAPYEPVEVDLWGTLYKTRPITRSLERKLDKLREKVRDAQTTDAAVKAYAEMLAVYLGDDKITALIDSKWKADELTATQMVHFVEQVVDADRPI